MTRPRRHFRLIRLLPVQFLSYLFLRLIAMVIGMFPFESLPVIGAILGRVIRLVDRKHARIAAKNLEKSPGVYESRDIPGFIARVYAPLRPVRSHRSGGLQRARRSSESHNPGIHGPLRGLRACPPEQWFWVHDRWKTAERQARVNAETVAT